MSYTLRQVQPLLTKPELELFQASRAAAVKEIAPHRLTSKIQRARALRDKYRDLYRRQTVQTRAVDPKSRKTLGGENTRTQTKGEIMDEVLKRFEAQQEKLLRQRDAAAAPKPRPSRKKPASPDASLAAGVKRLQNVVKAVRKAVTTDAKASSKKPAIKAKPRGTVSDAAPSTAPTDITPKAKRVNPLKAKPVNKKIHASASSRTRATQARRDAR